MSDERRPLGYLNDIDRTAFAGLSGKGACRTCRFWEPSEDPTYPEQDRFKFALEHGDLFAYAEYSGECHRYPPKLSSERFYQDTDREFQFPWMDWDDWCGEYVEGDDSLKS